MHWLPKKRLAPPIVGQIRSRRVFAWLPTTTEAGLRVWLEHYWLHQTFGYRVHGISGTSIGSGGPKWITLRKWSKYDPDDEEEG